MRIAALASWALFLSAPASASQESPDHLASAVVVALRNIDMDQLKALTISRSDLVDCFGDAPDLAMRLKYKAEQVRGRGYWGVGIQQTVTPGSRPFSGKPILRAVVTQESRLAKYGEEIKRGCKLVEPWSPGRSAPDCNWKTDRAKPTCRLVGFGWRLDVPVRFDDDLRGVLYLTMGLVGDRWYLMDVPNEPVLKWP